MVRFAFILFSAVVIMHSATAFADERPQWTVTLHEGQASIQVDGAAPLLCLTATIDAVTALGYEEIILNQIDASKQSVPETGVVIIATAAKDTVTIRSPRPIPIKTLVIFLERLDAASINRVAFEGANHQSPQQHGEPSDAIESR